VSEPARLTVIGVRHHSPACARLVRATIERVRPRRVLIEGPSDMNGRLAELLLPHTLPIAIFSYQTSARAGRSPSWTPLCAFSPEWVALQSARDVGADALFIDLPAWHKAFDGVSNRYADRRPDRASRLIARLCERLALSDADALWDHLFEQPLSEDALQRRLTEYFAELRGDAPADARDAPREEYMARFVDAALTEGGGPVVVVCGGYHAPVLERRVDHGASDAAWPEPPEAPSESRTGSYLVPYSFHRLDSFTGYESGMPSPAFQDAAFRDGPERAAERLLEVTLHRLRTRNQPVSAADTIAVTTMAEGLRRLRGHDVVTRVDLLDGLAGGLVKDALEAPLPWTYRGTLRRHTDPLLVEVMAAFSGDAIGRLAEGTPRPPLVDHVRAELEAHDLVPMATARRVELDWTQPAGLARSRVLHRLRVLRVPGFVREGGPRWATEGALGESWSLVAHLDADAALIEAGAYGATLEAAAAARLEERLLDAEGRLEALTPLLAEAVFIGIGTLAERILAAVAAQIVAETSLGTLGEALGHLLGLWRHDTLLGSAGTAALGTILEAAFTHGLWLVEGLRGATLPADAGCVGAMVGLRDTLRHGEGRLTVDRRPAFDVMQRRLDDPDAPPAIRGAALGFLWSMGGFASTADAETSAVAAVRRASRPETIGDFLAGLFALGREEVRRTAGLVAAVDSVVVGMADEEFLVALPPLRLAFGFFPPHEKEALAEQILARRGGASIDPRALTRPNVDSTIAAAGMALEAEVTAHARRFGLDDDASTETVAEGTP
jgi:hypothetical protein